MASLKNVAQMAEIEKKCVRVTPYDVSPISIKTIYLEQRHVYLRYYKSVYPQANLDPTIPILNNLRPYLNRLK